MLEILISAIMPVVTHSVVRPIRVVLLLRIGIHYLFEVFGYEIVSWVLLAPFAGCSLLLFQSVLLDSRQLNVIFFKRSLIGSQSTVRSGQNLFHLLGQMVQIHCEICEPVLPIVLLGVFVSFPDKFILCCMLQPIFQALRPFATESGYFSSIAFLVKNFADTFVFTRVAPTGSFEFNRHKLT